MDALALSEKLRESYENAGRNEATSQVILYGIKYAEELQACGKPLREIVIDSGISKGYLSELGKGVKLSKYVTIREGKENG